MSEYFEYLKDKKVILIGPSPSVLGKGYAEWVDCFDIVVRLNRAVECLDKVSKEVGKRVDVLYNCLHPGNLGGGNIDIDEWYRRKIKWICSPYPSTNFSERNIAQFGIRNNNRLGFHIFDKQQYNLIEREIGVRPNTGSLAIVDLLSSRLKELHVIGMTFGLDGYYSQYENITAEQYKQRANSGNHKINPQIKYIQEHIYNKDKRFKPNETLEYILKKK